MTLAASFWLHDIFHPLHGNGYQFWSGIAGSFVLGGGIWTGAFVTWRKHNCHARWCFRLGRHAVDGTPYVVCRRHHPTLPNGGATPEHIAAAHTYPRAYGAEPMGYTTSDDDGIW